MIKSGILEEFRPRVSFKNGDGVTLENIQAAYTDCANQMGIPVAFYRDQVTSGGLFNSSVQDCLVLYHPDHMKDYFKFCIRISYQGIAAFVSVDVFGESKQINKAARDEFAREDRKGKSMSYKLGSMIGAGLANIGKNKQKLEDEQNYYRCIDALFEEIEL